MAETPTVSIVIPSFRGAGYLDVALASIAPLACPARAEVIVVSDGPDDAVTAVVERHGVHRVTLPQHSGLNSARNAGINAARSDLVAFVDNDVAAPEGWLAALVAGAERYPDHEVFGGPIHARLERRLPACGREPAPITTLDAGPVDRDVPIVWGANMMIRRSAFERVGHFDPQLHGRGDEEEWLLRYAASGGRIRYLAAAVLDHRRTAEDSRLAALTRAAYGQGREARRHDCRNGTQRALASELRTLLGCAWHTIRRRCAYGIVMGAKTAGTVREALAERRA
ncbi:MAG: glycosyltransferase family 2 protein [Trebonia sp.]